MQFRHQTLHAALIALLPLALAACGETGATTSATGKSATIRSTPKPMAPKPTSPRPMTPKPIPAKPVAQIQAIPGLEGVIGASAEQLTSMFGAARLDVREEDGRKLQWSGTACILDVYLYPPASGGRQAATYVDARRGDGRDVDRAACVAALRKRAAP